MRTEITDADVVSALARHQGADNGVHVRELVGEITGGEIGPHLERQVRKAVAKLRTEEGMHICGWPETGYFFAVTPAELDATTEWLFDRAMTTLRQVYRMRGIAMPDLRGQLKLPT